jgi:hypothetical protein
MAFGPTQGASAGVGASNSLGSNDRKQQVCTRGPESGHSGVGSAANVSSPMYLHELPDCCTAANSHYGPKASEFAPIWFQRHYPKKRKVPLILGL